MTDDLIARLRANPTLRSTMFEAADALKAQARRIAELEEVHEANLKAIQINADVFADGMKKIMALCDAKDARIAELEAALKQSARVEASLASRIANLMDALEPFADVKVYPVLEDTTRVYDEPITYGDLRAAAAALKETGNE